MKIAITINLARYDEYEWAGLGEVVDAPEERAQELIAMGAAQAMPEDKPEPKKAHPRAKK